MKIFIDVGMSSSGYRLSGIVFIKLLIVRGSFSASFPVIAVRFSPTFRQGQRAGIQVVILNTKKQRVFSKWKTQVWRERKEKKRREEAGMDPVCCCYPSIPRGLSPLLSQASSSSYSSVINVITVEAESSACEGIWSLWINGVGGGGVGCTRAALLALLELDRGLQCPALNRGMEHLSDVDDHIWTERTAPRLSPRVSLWKLQCSGGKRLRYTEKKRER